MSNNQFTNEQIELMKSIIEGTSYTLEKSYFGINFGCSDWDRLTKIIFNQGQFSISTTGTWCDSEKAEKFAQELQSDIELMNKLNAIINE